MGTSHPRTRERGARSPVKGGAPPQLPPSRGATALQGRLPLVWASPLGPDAWTPCRGAPKTRRRSEENLVGVVTPMLI